MAHDFVVQSHVRVRLRLPELHSAVQFDHSPHGDQTPSTGQQSVLHGTVSSNVSVHDEFADRKLLTLVFSPTPHDLVHSVHADHSVTLQ